MKFKNIFVFVNKPSVKISAAVVGLYLIFLLATAPASILFSNIKLPPNLRITSVSGTVWNGRIEHVEFSGIQVGSVQWVVHPLALLLGSLSVDIEIKNKAQYLTTTMKLSPLKKIQLEGTLFDVDLALFQPLIYGMPIAYSGQAKGALPHFSFKKNDSISLNGKMSLNAIKLISPQQQEFGNFIIDFNSINEKSIKAVIRDDNAPLKLNGNIDLDHLGQLKLATQFSALEENSSLDKMLDFLGRADEKGQRQFETSFTLWH